MTNQREPFDPARIIATVTAHLLAQGRKSLRPHDSGNPPETCLYRGPDGRKCAIGCLIPDEKYTPDMDDGNGGSDVQSLWMRSARKLGFERLDDPDQAPDELMLTGDAIAPLDYMLPQWASPTCLRELRLLQDLQEVHDNRAPETWRKELSDVLDEWCSP